MRAENRNVANKLRELKAPLNKQSTEVDNLKQALKVVKKKSSHEYLDSAGSTMEFGSWTKMETCILSTAESYLALNNTMGP